MQKRIKFQKTLIAILAFVSAILIVSLLVGRNETATVLVVNDEDIDLSRTIGDQKEKFILKEISKSDFAKFGDSLVSSKEAVEKYRLKEKLSVGTPITMSALTNSVSVGTFAQETPALHTTFSMSNAVSTLPAGLQKGDVIDIYLFVDALADAKSQNTEVDEEETEDNKKIDYTKINGSINLLLSNVLISSTTDTSIELKVSQTDYNILYLAQKLGQFVVHLPGQKDVKSCDDVYNELKKSYDTAYKELTKSSYFKKDSKDSQNAQLRELKSNYEYNIHAADCITNEDKIDRVTSKDILLKLQNGESFSEILESSDYADQFLENNPFSNISIDDVFSPIDEGDATTEEETVEEETTEKETTENDTTEDTKDTSETSKESTSTDVFDSLQNRDED